MIKIEDLKRLFSRKEKYDLPYNKEYYDLYKNAEFVPCIVTGKLIKRHHTVITAEGFMSLEAFRAKNET